MRGPDAAQKKSTRPCGRMDVTVLREGEATVARDTRTPRLELRARCLAAIGVPSRDGVIALPRVETSRRSRHRSGAKVRRIAAQLLLPSEPLARARASTGASQACSRCAGAARLAQRLLPLTRDPYAGHGGHRSSSVAGSAGHQRPRCWLRRANAWTFFLDFFWMAFARLTTESAIRMRDERHRHQSLLKINTKELGR